MKHHKFILLVLVVMLACTCTLIAQSSSAPSRVGTTASGFLELGFEPRGISMGEAYVSTVDNLTAQYWNPAGLSFMSNNEVFFAYQPWIADTYTYFASVGFVTPTMGTFAVGIMGINYGEMEVTTLDLQEGTGENFTPTDLAFNLSYGQSLTSWFGLGATIKYIHSSIYHTTANAIAADLGIIIKTAFLSTSGDEREGMKIGMSLSNYGTRMQYSGLDLMRSVDISPDESGNYKNVKADLQTGSWELPLIFRVGFAVNPIVQTRHRLTLAADALHVNNNSESVNLGAEYSFNMPGTAKVFFRGGYRGLFLEESQFGPTFGFGVLVHSSEQKGFQIDYAYRDIGILGYVSVLGASFTF
jgi:hypothetical protein